VAELAILGLGATFGFLLVNFPKGRLFLGDGGAYFLGFWVSEVAVLLLVRNPSVSAWQVLAICAYPVIEVLFSIYRRKILRQSSPGSPDGLHLHTLVYRRVVSRVFSLNKDLPWQRNAAVTCVMVPWVAGAALASVVAGATVVNSMIIVAAQLIIYMLVYARIVRGRWWGQPASAVAAPALTESRWGRPAPVVAAPAPTESWWVRPASTVAAPAPTESRWARPASAVPALTEGRWGRPASAVFSPASTESERTPSLSTPRFGDDAAESSARVDERTLKRALSS
jgi:hypothetical protein